MKMPAISRRVLWNALQFQLCWFALVYSAARGQPIWGIAAVLALIALHLLRFAHRGEWRLLLVVGAGGWLWETLVWRLGVLQYPDYSLDALMAPLWMGALWLNFAATLCHSLVWLRGDLLFSVLTGAVGGPLAFLAGEKLGAVIFANEVWTTLFLALSWGVLTPLLFKLSSALVVSDSEGPSREVCCG